jgi:hypothetical protein
VPILTASSRFWAPSLVMTEEMWFRTVPEDR